VQFDERQRWLGLSIRENQAGNTSDQEGHVEFVARFKVNGKGHRLHEKSRFAKVDDDWYYVSGEFL
jgi:SEC-C motif-containing protein